MLFRKHVRIGLDIGAAYLKAVVLSSDGKHVLDLICRELIPDRQSQEQKGDTGYLCGVISESLAKYISSKSNYDITLATAVQGEGLICSYIELPQLQEKEMELAVSSVVQKYIPFSLKEIVLTYVPVPVLKPGSKNSAVFFIAAHNNLVDRYKEIFQECKLEVERMEVPAVALAREFARNHSTPADQFSPLIHMGDRITQVVVTRNGYPYYVRDFSIGGADFTYAFQMGMQTSWQKAEEYKYEYDIARGEVFLEPILIQWVDEVRDTLDFFSRQHQQSLGSSSLYLSGGGVLLQGLDRRLGQHLKMPVIVDSWDKLHMPKKMSTEVTAAGFYKVALGLAL